MLDYKRGFGHGLEGGDELWSKLFAGHVDGSVCGLDDSGGKAFQLKLAGDEPASSFYTF